MLMSRSNRPTMSLLLGGFALALMIGSCADNTAGPSPQDTPAFKRGGVPGGGPGKDADPVVAAVDPDSASQDTTIDVLVLGSDFDEGSVATWLIDEAPDPLNRIHTNHTTYVNPKRLIANITIAADAETTLYDVEVKTSKGRKGVGIEVFRVKVKAEPIPVEATLRDDAGDGVWSDGGGVYAAEIDENGNLFLDARVATERQICLDFAGQPGAPYDDLPGADVCDAAWISTFDPYENGGLQTLGLGGTRPVRLGVSWVKDRFNWGLAFGRDCETGELLPGDLAVASATGADTWEIEAGYATLCRFPTRGKPRTEYVGRFALPVHLQLVRVPAP
jgi:hypothetical protein